MAIRYADLRMLDSMESDEMSGYDSFDPKHPDYHGTYADVWDLRDKFKPVAKNFTVGMFFEKVITVCADDIDHARRIGMRQAEGLADKEELEITEVVVVDG